MAETANESVKQLQERIRILNNELSQDEKDTLATYKTVRADPARQDEAAALREALPQAAQTILDHEGAIAGKKSRFDKIKQEEERRKGRED